MFEQQLHGVVVWQRQSLNQVLHVGDSQAVVWDFCVIMDTEMVSHAGRIIFKTMTLGKTAALANKEAENTTGQTMK